MLSFTYIFFYAKIQISQGGKFGMNTPLVSVIMPAYNAEKYIEKAIDSVLCQNDISYELIIIIDGANDNTVSLLKQYESNDSIIIIQNERNIGVAASRNKGIAMARGQYIAFLDTDDWWTCDKLKRQVELIQEKHCVLTYTARELFDDNGKPTGNIIPVHEEISYESLVKHNIINCSSVLMETAVAREFYMQHDDSHEDYLMWLKVLKKYKIAYGINEPLLKYRLSINGKSRNKFKSAKMTYKVHRYLGENPVTSLIRTSSQLARAGLKYLKV